MSQGDLKHWSRNDSFPVKQPVRDNASAVKMVMADVSLENNGGAAARLLSHPLLGWPFDWRIAPDLARDLDRLETLMEKKLKARAQLSISDQTRTRRPNSIGNMKLIVLYYI